MEETSQTTHTIEMEKSPEYPHMIRLYKKNWQNQDAWTQLVKQLNLTEDTEEVGLILSKNMVK